MRALEAVEAADVTAFAHGMTVATNALLERRGARTALVTTEGFRDLIELARQDRPALYDLAERRPEPLVPRDLRFTVRERMGPDGELEPLDEDSLEEAVDALREAEVDAVAVCLLFAFLHPEHEQQRRRGGARSAPATSTSRSRARCSPSSASTSASRPPSPTPTSARSSPPTSSGWRAAPTRRACRRRWSCSPRAGWSTSAWRRRQAAGCVLSGPAGGVVGAAHVARASGYEDVLTFDMGGT